MSYFKGTTGITATVVGGSFKLKGLALGETRSITVKISTIRRARYGTTKTVGHHQSLGGGDDHG
jgi:hypothetical protein